MAVLTSESVLADLRHLPLLTAEQLARVESAAGRSLPSAEKIVKRLVDREWLTPFQAEVLLAGKANGLVFGHYVLLARVGEGGMGVVFKARHARLGRIDALKVIRADKIASKLVAHRFLREIQLTADLNHPHIVKALDAGQVGKQLYLATEFIAGEDLTATVRRQGCFSVADACLVIYQTALALRHIHERGLIHRDLKPSNIMREEKTRAVKVLDLGLCNSLHDLPAAASQAGALTRDGVMLGTPDFMPPEQARNPHGVDIRADQYALGCTFFYLLTGRTPYEGSPIEKVLQHTTAPAPPLVLPRSSTPPALAAIVAKMMAKRPDDRFQTPQDLIDALLALRPGQAIDEPHPEGLEPVAAWQSEFDLLIAQDPSASGSSPMPPELIAAKRPKLGRWLAAAAVLVAISLAGFLVARPKSNPEPGPVEGAPQNEPPVDELQAFKKAVQTPGENRDQLRTRVLAFRAKYPGQPQAIAAANLLRKLPSPLDKLAPVKDDVTESPVVRVGEAGNSVTSLFFSATDDKLVIVRSGQAPEEWSLPALKENGRFAGMPVREDGFTTVSFDGRSALTIDADGKLVVWQDGGWRRVDMGADSKAAFATVLPDGKGAVVALAESDERLIRVALDSGRIATRLDHPSEGVQFLAVAPDGSSCLVFGPENMIRVLSLTNGKLLQAFDTPPNADAEPAGGFGPDGQRLYLIGAFRTAGRFAPGSLNPLASYEVAQEKPNPFFPRSSLEGRPTCIAAAADETTVAVGTRSGHVHIYSAATGKAQQEFRFARTVRQVAFSTHGRVLAIALDDGSVVLLPLKG